MQKERSFQCKFTAHMRLHGRTGAYELKVASGRALPFRAVKQHQRASLLAVRRGTFVYKIPDDTRGHKPFDTVCMREQDAFVVILYPTGNFYLIDIEMFLVEERRSVRKSLTEERAKIIAT